MDTKTKALQLMDMPGELRFSKDGKWRHDSVLVSHQQIAQYFSQHLEYSETHGSFVVAVDGRCVAVKVEDTPFVVSGFDTSDQNAWQMLLNTGQLQPFDPSTLSISSDNVLYCRGGEENQLLRILRSAMQTIWPLVVEEAGKYFVELHGSRFAVQELER